MANSPITPTLLLILALLLGGCQETQRPMTAEQMKAAIEECAKYDLKAMFWRSYNYRIVEASCEPKDR